MAGLLQSTNKVLLAALAASLQACAVGGQPTGSAPGNDTAAVAAIRNVLTTQTAAWNRGDIPGFMEGYWKSDSLVFLGRKGPTYGWQQTLDNYKRGYPNAAAMGQLDFSGLRVTLLNPNAAQVIGRWHLARPVAGDVQGYFLLIMRQVDGKWVVAADHTNSQE
jgi:ketosteroid isomerase-like protein